MASNIYVFLHPSDRHRATKLGFRLCLLGWKTENSALFCPLRRTKCDMLHIDVSKGCKETEGVIFEEAQKLGARGVFLDADESSDDISELAFALNQKGLTVFSSVITKDSFLVENEKGNNRLLCPRMQKTSIYVSGRSNKTTITHAELEALKQRLCPKESYSEELGSNYFSSKGRNETVFVVYDTPETFRRRLFSCGAENVFVHMSSIKEYLTEGK